MENFSKSRWAPRLFGLLLIAFFATQGCDSGMGIDPVTNSLETREATDQVRYVYGTFDNGEEHAVEVILDDRLVQERRTFGSEEDYYDEVDRLMEKDKLVVNASLYRQFIHALYPAEIYLLDMEGEVVVGQYVYSTTEVAAYKYLVSDPNSTPELEEYWGKDGQEVEREYSRFYSHIGRPEDMFNKNSFKNPFIQSQADEFVSAAKFASPSQEGENFKIMSRGKYRDSDETAPKTVCLPSSRAREANLSQWCYSVKFLYWNESTHTRRRRALAGIETMVLFQDEWYDLAQKGPPGLGERLRLKVSARGGHSERTDTCIASLLPGTLDYSNNPPYSGFIGTGCNSVNVVANRKPRRGAASTHTIGFHEYFTPETRNGTVYLMYSYSGSWNGGTYTLD